MAHKTFKYKIVALTTFLSSGILTLGLVHVLYAPLDSVMSASFVSDQEQVIVDTNAQTPTRLSIPSLGVDATIRPVGVTGDGTVASPARYADVGWYHEGVTPGQSGSSLLAGHFDNGLGLPGVFYDLDRIKVGDEIVVVDTLGVERTFKVTDRKMYPYNQPLSADFMESHGRSELRLVTCSGRWLSNKQTYDERLVVFARLVE